MQNYIITKLININFSRFFFMCILVFVIGPRFPSTINNTSIFSSYRVRGFNQPGDISDSSMGAMASTGANIVRFFVDLRLNTSTIQTATSYTFDNAPLQSIITSAAKYGFKVVIVLDDPNNTLLDSALWSDTSKGESLRASIASIWHSIASKYNGDPTVAAYDLFNEPVIENSNSQAAQNQWLSIASSWITIIRAVDLTHPIIFEPTPWALAEAFSTTLKYPLPFNNIVYSFHEYDPHEFTHQGIGDYKTSETYPTSIIGPFNLANTMRLASVRSFQKQFNVPIYVGEFGCTRWAPISASNGLSSCYNWVHDTISVFEVESWSWTYHDWRGYFGWDADIPETFFYQFPYTEGHPNLDWRLYDSKLVPLDVHKSAIGFSRFRDSTTDTMMLLRNYFLLNVPKTCAHQNEQVDKLNFGMLWRNILDETQQILKSVVRYWNDFLRTREHKP